jgi:hypothetical protein
MGNQIKYFIEILIGKPIPVAVRSKMQIWSLLNAGIAGSNPAEDMDVGHLCSFGVL